MQSQQSLVPRLWNGVPSDRFRARIPLRFLPPTNPACLAAPNSFLLPVRRDGSACSTRPASSPTRCVRPMSTRPRSGASCRAPAPTGWPAPRPTRRSKSVQLDDELRGCLHPRRRHRGRGRPPHPAQGQSGRRSRAMPAAAVGAQPPRLHRDLPGDAEGGVSPAPDRNPRALQAARARTTSRPISAPANGAARPAATPCRASPDRSWSRWSAPTPTSSACRSTRSITLLGGEGFPIRFGWLNAS